MSGPDGMGGVKWQNKLIQEGYHTDQMQQKKYLLKQNDDLNRGKPYAVPAKKFTRKEKI